MPPKKKYQITKKMLTNLHIKQQLTPNEIAVKLGCHHTLVRHYLKNFDIKKLPKYERLQGKKFGRLLVKSLLGIDNRAALWQCICDCGAIVKATTGQLKFGQITSCGCYSKDCSTTHKMSGTRPYRIWQAMKTRCTNPNAINFHLYGGRGISYDPAWEVFERFWVDMRGGYADNLSIERINNDKGYNKQNCCWITPHRQNFNKRVNVCLTYNNEKLTITEWADKLGVNRRKLYQLHDKGLSDEEIFKNIKNTLT